MIRTSSGTRLALHALAALPVLCAASGCSSPPSAQDMSVTTSDVQTSGESHLRRSLALGEVTGGQETDAWKGSRVGDPEFGEALTTSLDALGWLASAGEARYRLDAELQEQESSNAGLDIDAWLTVRYVLTPTGGGDPVYDHTIKTGFRAPHGVAFSGVEKLELAFEGAARDSIARMLAGVGALPPAAGAP